MAKSLKDRIERRLSELGINGFEASRRAGLGRDFVNDILTGRKTNVRAANLSRLALALDMEVDALLSGEPSQLKRIKVVGYVGAASEYFGFDDNESGAAFDDIEAPPGVSENAVAVIVRGDSGYPAIRDGMILIYWNKLEDPTSVVGEDCFVRTKDGRTLVKILERGSQPHLWTLRSINSATPPIFDVEIEWAAPIEVRLRRMNWKAE